MATDGGDVFAESSASSDRRHTGAGSVDDEAGVRQKRHVMRTAALFGCGTDIRFALGTGQRLVVPSDDRVPAARPTR
jgi:hypothetical protein